MPGVTVAEEGNKRKGKMSPDEFKQCAIDVQGWFKRHGAPVDARASNVDFQRLSKGVDAPIPDTLEALLGEVNGGMWFMDKKALSCEEIIVAANACESLGEWKKGFVPFAGDDMGMLVIDTKTEEVLEWDVDDGVGSVVAPCFEDYMETYRNTLMGGKCEFDSEIGVIEGVGATRK